MSSKQVQDKIRATRRDIGNLVFHFTKQSRKSSAFEIIKKMMKKKKLIASSGCVRGSHKVICFTEAPISELASYFNAQSLLSDGEKLRYEPYGVAFTKEKIFKKGALPVIYQPDSHYDLLDVSQQYRHVRFELPKIDFTWEREWRLRSDELSLTPSECLIIVKTQEEVSELIQEFSKFEPDIDAERDYDGSYVEVVSGVIHSLE